MADELEMSWKLSDPGMDLLERAGLAGLYMALARPAMRGRKFRRSSGWMLTCNPRLSQSAGPGQQGQPSQSSWNGRGKSQTVTEFCSC